MAVAVMNTQELEAVRIEPRAFVRGRPERFLGPLFDGTALHRMVYELIDNAVAEALRGYGDHINVTIDSDLTATVEDRGRGLPVGLDEAGHDRLEGLMTTIGRTHREPFRCARDHWLNPFVGRYRVTGLAAVNFLSRRLMVEVQRDGERWRQIFDEGAPRESSKRIERTTQTGTRMTAEADPRIFDRGKVRKLDRRRIEQRLDDLSVLVPGLKFELADRRTGYEVELHAPRGARDRLQTLLAQPLYDAVFHLEECDELGCGFQLAVGWTREPRSHVESFVNGDRTPGDGTHVDGLRAGIDRAVEQVVGASDGAGPNMRGVLALTMEEASYQGMRRERLTTPVVAARIEAAVVEALPAWLRTQRELRYAFKAASA